METMKGFLQLWESLWIHFHHKKQYILGAWTQAAKSRIQSTMKPLFNYVCHFFLLLFLLYAAQMIVNSALPQ